MQEIFAISGLVNGIVAGAFGILVISKNWRDRVNQVYFLMTLSLALWAFAYWQWLLSVDYAQALFLVRILSVGSLFIPIFFFHWVILLLDENKSVSKLLLWLSYIMTVTILFFVGSPEFVSGLQPKLAFTLWPDSGRIYDIYFCYLYIGLVTYTLYLLCRSYFVQKDANKKGQILFVIFGSVLGFGGGLTNFPLWFGIPIPPYGNFLVAAFPFFLGYSVLRYKLFNARTIATEILVFFTAIILLIQAIVPADFWQEVLHWVVFAVVSVMGILIIRSVYHEVEQREKIESLAEGLRLANERLRELDKQKTEFISFASHQLRAPLTAIKGYASLLEEGDIGLSSTEGRQAVGRIFESASTMANVVEDYLNVSRIELGTMKYDFHGLDMGKLVEEVVGELKPNIQKSGLDFKLDIVGEGPWFVTADQDKLKQVVVNLIDNSIKYTPKGFVKVSLERVHAVDGTIPVRFSVEDSGIGIAPEIMPKLFQKFSRAEGANKQNIHGTGLGLFIAKDVVTAHKGKIWAESAGEGKGAKFIVELPAV